MKYRRICANDRLLWIPGWIFRFLPSTESLYYKSDRKVCKTLKYTSGLTVQCSEKHPCSVHSKYSERQIRWCTNRGDLQKHAGADFTKFFHYRQGLTQFLPVRSITTFADIRCLSATVVRRLHTVIVYVYISVTFFPIVSIPNSKSLKNLRDNLGQIIYFEYFEKLGRGAPEN
jgi:hypothetical protein